MSRVAKVTVEFYVEVAQDASGRIDARDARWLLERLKEEGLHFHHFKTQTNGGRGYRLTWEQPIADTSPEHIAETQALLRASAASAGAPEKEEPKR